MTVKRKGLLSRTLDGWCRLGSNNGSCDFGSKLVITKAAWNRTDTRVHVPEIPVNSSSAVDRIIKMLAYAANKAGTSLDRITPLWIMPTVGVSNEMVSHSFDNRPVEAGGCTRVSGYRFQCGSAPCTNIFGACCGAGASVADVRY